jgi:hypothetical protein
MPHSFPLELLDVAVDPGAVTVGPVIPTALVRPGALYSVLRAKNQHLLAGMLSARRDLSCDLERCAVSGSRIELSRILAYMTVYRGK